jgi:RNA polymerase primary sigma factor
LLSQAEKKSDDYVHIEDFLAESKNVEPLITEFLSSIESLDCEIVKLRHGLTNGFEHSYVEIGSRFGITPERVAEIETIALAKLKEIGEQKWGRSY